MQSKPYINMYAIAREKFSLAHFNPSCRACAFVGGFHTISRLCPYALGVQPIAALVGALGCTFAP